MTSVCLPAFAAKSALRRTASVAARNYSLCYIPVRRMELISPSDFAKEKVRSVQEYAVLSAQSIGNMFRRPL